MQHDSLEQEFYQYACVVKLIDGYEMTPTEISGAIIAIKNGIDIFTKFVDTKDAMKYAEITRVVSTMNLELSKLEVELAESQIKFAKSQVEIATKIQEVTKLEIQNHALESKIKELENPKVEFQRNDHCSACYESSRKVITLIPPQDFIDARINRYKKECPVCKVKY